MCCRAETPHGTQGPSFAGNDVGAPPLGNRQEPCKEEVGARVGHGLQGEAAVAAADYELSLAGCQDHTKQTLQTQEGQSSSAGSEQARV